MHDDTTFVFGRFRLLRRRRELLCDGVPVDVGSRALEILLALIARNGQLVTKDELMAEVWPSTVVDEGNLTTHISTLRKKLGDGSAEDRYILTVPGRGYRFVAPVSVEDPTEARLAEQQPIARSQKGGEGAAQALPRDGSPNRLPSGTVSFLFTDIEGSTQRWARDHAAMAAALVEHDKLLSTCVAEHGGIVFKKVGDSICAAFPDTIGALKAAVSAQRALLVADWASVDGLRVRMAVHTGVVDLVGGDYFGMQVAKVARIVSTAHGGQIVLSTAAYELSIDALPEELFLVDLGLHQLKDISNAERIYSVTGPGLLANFPPLRSAVSNPNNLPAQITALIGRDEEVEAVKGAFESSRLVTLTGIGGIGKTRLSLEVASALLPNFADGAWLIDLAAIGDPALVVAQFGKPFSIRDQAGVEPLTVLSSMLAGKKTLLVVDNCEHVVATVSSVVSTLLQACPALHVLATSTQRLGIPGETEIRLETLPTPDARLIRTADEALRIASVRLFVERARSANGRFVLSDQQVSLIAEICRQLDGIPLAIELAAARTRALTLHELSLALAKRLDALRSRETMRAARHQTLRSSIEWSYGLLSPEERDVFIRLGVFTGSFDMDSIIAISDGLAHDEFELREIIFSLIEKSFLSVDHSGTASRYRLLSSLREFAREQLERAGMLDASLRQHAAYYFNLADRLDFAFNMQPFDKLETLKGALDNFRAALDWAITTGRAPGLGANLAGALSDLWAMVPLLSEGSRWCEAALAVATDERTYETGRSYLALATCLNGLTIADRARAAAGKACEVFRSSNDKLMLARSLRQLFWACGHAGDFESADLALEEGLALARSEDDKALLAKCLLDYAVVLARHGNLEQANASFNEAEAAFRALGDRKGELVSVINRAESHSLGGNVQAAAADLKVASSLADGLGDKRISVHCLCSLAKCLLELDDISGSIAAAHCALPKAREIGWEGGFALAIENLAAIAAKIGDFRKSIKLFSYADIIYDRIGKIREESDYEYYKKTMNDLRISVDSLEMEAIIANAASLTEEDVLEICNNIPSMIEKRSLKAKR